MLCRDAVAILARIDAGQLTHDDLAAVIDLAADGLVREVPPEPPVDLAAGLRQRLADVRARRDELKLLSAAAVTPEERAGLAAKAAELEREERGIRASILASATAPAAQGQAQGRSFALTWLGRDLLGEIPLRLTRLGGTTIQEFRRQIETLRSALGAGASRARDIGLALTKKAEVDLDDIGSIAIGLSRAPGTPEQLADQFLAETKSITSIPIGWAWGVAEAAVGRPPGTARTAIGLVPSAVAKPDDRAAAAAILVTRPIDGWRDLLDRAVANPLGEEFTPALAAQALGTSLPDARALAVRVRDRAGKDDAELSAVLLLLSPVGAERAFERFATLHAWLSGFTPVGMSVPAAALALMDAEVPEILDNLRITGGEVQTARLSSGAGDNLALATKLLIQLAARDTDPLLPSADASGANFTALGAVFPLAGMLPGAVSTVSSVHRASVYRRTWPVHHPLHSHLVYG